MVPRPGTGPFHRGKFHGTVKEQGYERRWIFPENKSLFSGHFHQVLHVVLVLCLLNIPSPKARPTAFSLRIIVSLMAAGEAREMRWYGDQRLFLLLQFSSAISSWPLSFGRLYICVEQPLSF